MARSREYAATVTVSRNELVKMSIAQDEVIRNGGFDSGRTDVAALIAGLSGIGATILGLMFIASTPVGIATGIASLASSLLGAGTGSRVNDYLQDGVNGMNRIVNTIIDNDLQYDLYQIKFPFLEYTLQDDTVIRFITGNGVILKAHSENGWEVF
ncbi:hypothetical protein [Paenibacillus brasilensis]|uniref:Uncharacterized protein n=1 Tax=Paenibacillus brasilensis TaxID=128574 RepID=A0ABU0L6H5_9BACL|nr:hypothetical protein [Paenibacillus brasilensis]MDQ0496893.1 hypothetical protein [Paenibacillus brasilensis]